MDSIVTQVRTAATAGTPRFTEVRSPVAGSRPGPTSPPNADQVRQAVDQANAALKSITSNLEFTIDSSTGKTVVRVVDSSTQQVIRQFPSEEMLSIARAVDRLQGMLLKQKA
jgi:flagellar protein FlaG